MKITWLTIWVTIMIIFSAVILFLGFSAIGEISPLASDYVLANIANKITLENNPFSKVNNLIGYTILLSLYSSIPSACLAFDKQSRCKWLSLFWTPGTLALFTIVSLTSYGYFSLYNKIIKDFDNAHFQSGGLYIFEVDPTPYINRIFALIKPSVSGLVTTCVLICIYIFIVIFTGIWSATIPRKSASKLKNHYSKCANSINNQQSNDYYQNECIFCTQCGNELESDAKFCSFCGAGIENNKKRTAK